MAPAAPSDALTACLNCGSDDTDHWAWARDIEYSTSQDEWEYRRCRTCGVLFMPSPPIERLSEIYPDNYYSYVGEGRSVTDRVKSWMDGRLLGSVTQRVAGDDLALLDVGGGTGYLATRARRADPRITTSTVVDLDDRCRAEAVAAGHDFVCSRVEELSTDQRFDVILAVNLIEHVAEPRSVLAAFRTLLRPGGRVLVKTPNHRSLDARLFRHRSWGGYHCPRHWVLFDEPSLETASAASGLEVEWMRYTQGAPFWSVSILHEAEERGLLRGRPGAAPTEHPLFGPVAAVAAAFDLARRPVARTSQMVAVLARGGDAAQASTR